ncbi:MAG: PQQ-binding-like beta-propeller repeat protein [Steroidobacteraceae bacterium]
MIRGWIRFVGAVQLVIGCSVVYAMDAGVNIAEVQEGLQLFTTNCAACHGAAGQGGQLGPNLLPKVASTDDAALAAYLRAGNPTKGMPPAPIEGAQMPALTAYLRSIARTVGTAAARPGTGTRGASGPTTIDPANRYASMPHITRFTPVTDAMLLAPSPNDWLWFSRTPDAQRFSPLDQIKRNNVSGLILAWSKGLPAGITETIPTVYDGVMYVTLPGGNVAALDATTGDTIWRYNREYKVASAGFQGRSKTLAIYLDMIYFTAPDQALVALDAKTGALRWETPTGSRGNTSGAIVVDGKVMSSGTCGNTREQCNITAHDARTGKLVWTFYLTQAPDDPVPGIAGKLDTWAGVPTDKRRASSWGLPGSYDAATHTLYWSVANPTPYTRLERHGNADAIPTEAPADLYSNSTLALDPATGKLKWYYQHLPGDDWDDDMNEERVLLRTRVNPDPKHVRWISPKLKPGAERDIVVNVGEGGGLWALDKATGEFLWATPFPWDVPNFILSDINVNTGATIINRKLVLDKPGKQSVICFFNARSYWPTAYSPRTNSLYVPYINNCLQMTSGTPASAGQPGKPQSRVGTPMAGTKMEEMNGLAKINMETGQITHWPTGPIPTNSSILATAGDLVFMGDINRRYWAQDAETGKVLWRTVLPSPVSTSNITYSVNGRQYIAVITGSNQAHPGLNTGTMGPVQLNLDNSGDSNAIMVFALPPKP